MTSIPTRFVADTHTLWWYLRSPEKLNAAASAVFRLAETGNATIVIPAIVVAEFYYLSLKLGQPFPPWRLMDMLSSAGWMVLSELGRAQLENLHRLPDVPEMHDRLIAAESMAFDAPVLTRDETLTASNQVETIW